MSNFSILLLDISGLILDTNRTNVTNAKNPLLTLNHEPITSVVTTQEKNTVVTFVRNSSL